MKAGFEVTGKVTTHKKSDEEDFAFWADASPQERLAENTRLLRMVWRLQRKPFPEKMEKTGRVIKKTELDKDEF